MQNLWIGTSGFHYQHWKGHFYPPDLLASQSLVYYAVRFDTVENNNSFYQLPGVETIQAWIAAVPAGYIFAVKASRFITHMKKLSDPVASSAKFFERAALLDEKFGPILFQLPPHWRANPQRLDEFLAALPTGHYYAFGFRDPDWLTERVYSVLQRHNAALCLDNFNRRTTPIEVTADFVYIRLHGAGGPYQGKYSSTELEDWTAAIEQWTGQGKIVYRYFDNDMAEFAPQNALELARRLAVKSRSL